MLIVELRVRTRFHEGLLKDFPGPFLAISRTFLWQFNSNPSKMFVLNDTGLALWHSTRPQNTYRNLQKGASKHVQTRHELHTCTVAQHTCPRVTSESTGNEKYCLIFTHFVSIENAMLCLPEHLFACSHLLKALKALIIFNLIQKKQIKDQKPISNTLKSDSWNSRVFKMCANTENLRVWWWMCL